MDFNRSTIYISGTSKGLGKALAEEFLGKGSTVFGMGRNSTIDHPNYHHQFIDLSSNDKVLEFKLPSPIQDSKDLILINNAARLGEVAPFEDLSENDILDSVGLNFIAPILLIKKFLNLQCNEGVTKYVLNIGTGAAQNAMDGWSMYCSTKAGLLMFSEVVFQESLLGRSNCRIVNLSPGIVDTNMQAEIRNANAKEFSQVKRFIEYHKLGELQSAQQTARLIIRNFDSLFNKNNSSDSIRNYT